MAYADIQEVIRLILDQTIIINSRNVDFKENIMSE